MDRTVIVSLRQHASNSEFVVASPGLGIEIIFEGLVLQEIQQQKLWSDMTDVVAAISLLWKDGGSVTFVASAPRRFMGWLQGRANTHTDKWEVSRGAIDESELEDCLPLEALTRCVELSLHHWRNKKGKKRCAVCSAAWEQVPNESRLGGSLLAMIAAAPLKGRDRRTYETFEKMGQKVKDDRLRVVLHSEGLSGATDEDLAALKYVLALGTSHYHQRAWLLRTKGKAGPIESVTPVETFERTDTEGRHLLEMKLPSPAPLVNLQLCERKTLERLTEEYGEDGATGVAVGAGWGHLTVTLDPNLLKGDAHRLMSDAAVVKPLEAARLLALRARFIPTMPPTDDGSLSLRPQHYYDARPYVQIPHLRAAHAWMQALEEEKRERCLALFWSTHQRLSLLCRAEDEIGFRHFFQFGRPIEDELLYHLEFLILTAQALFEGLRVITTVVEDVPPRTGWDVLLEQRSDDAVASFIKNAGQPLMGLVGALRHPMAHERRWEIYHGADTPSIHVADPEATEVATCLAKMREPAVFWGIADHAINMDGTDLVFQPYPFAVSLTARLLWFSECYLKALTIDGEEQELAAPAPWEMTNPRLDESSHRLIELLSWPVPPVPAD